MPENGFNDIVWIHLSRSGGIHIRYDSCHAQGRVEEGKQGEGRQIDLAGLYVEVVTNAAHLGIECTVRVNHPFGWSCATGGEQYGGNVVSTGFGNRKGLPGCTPDVLKRHSVPEPFFTYSDGNFNGFKKLGIKRS